MTEIECNADAGHACDADNGEPCPSCKESEAYWRRYWSPTMREAYRGVYDAEERERNKTELREAGRGHLVRP